MQTKNQQRDRLEDALPSVVLWGMYPSDATAFLAELRAYLEGPGGDAFALCPRMDGVAEQKWRLRVYANVANVKMPALQVGLPLGLGLAEWYLYVGNTAVKRLILAVSGQDVVRQGILTAAGEKLLDEIRQAQSVWWTVRLGEREGSSRWNCLFRTVAGLPTRPQMFVIPFVEGERGQTVAKGTTWAAFCEQNEGIRGTALAELPLLGGESSEVGGATYWRNVARQLIQGGAVIGNDARALKILRDRIQAGLEDGVRPGMSDAWYEEAKRGLRDITLRLQTILRMFEVVLPEGEADRLTSLAKHCQNAPAEIERVQSVANNARTGVKARQAEDANARHKRIMRKWSRRAEAEIGILQREEEAQIDAEADQFRQELEKSVLQVMAAAGLRQQMMYTESLVPAVGAVRAAMDIPKPTESVEIWAKRARADLAEPLSVLRRNLCMLELVAADMEGGEGEKSDSLREAEALEAAALERLAAFDCMMKEFHEIRRGPLMQRMGSGIWKRFTDRYDFPWVSLLAKREQSLACDRFWRTLVLILIVASLLVVTLWAGFI